MGRSIATLNIPGYLYTRLFQQGYRYTEELDVIHDGGSGPRLPHNIIRGTLLRIFSPPPKLYTGITNRPF